MFLDGYFLCFLSNTSLEHIRMWEAFEVDTIKISTLGVTGPYIEGILIYTYLEPIIEGDVIINDDVVCSKFIKGCLVLSLAEKLTECIAFPGH